MIDELNTICGTANVLTGADAAQWTRDATLKYHWQPLAVVRPANTEEVAALIRLATAHAVPVVPVAGNTGLNGGTFAEGALMIAFDRMNRIRNIDAAARTITVEAGVILSQIHDAVASHDLIFPLTFGARGSARVGGFLSTNAGGSNVLRYGNTRALVLGVEVVLADGRVLNAMSALHKDNTGYDLRDLFIGAEGTLGLITAAVLKLAPAPRAHATALVAMERLSDALALLNRLQGDTGGAVECFEFMPDIYMDRLRERRPDLSPPIQTGAVNILIEAASTAPALTDPATDGTLPLQALLEGILGEGIEACTILDATIAATGAQRQKLWEMREAAAEITLLPGAPTVDTDIAVPLGAVDTFLTRMRARLHELDPEATEMVVAHLGDGNIHYTAYPSRNDPDLLTTLRAIIAEEAVALGGTFSAEHGIGISKLPTMIAMKDPVALDVMSRIRHALDPQGVFNPGKTVPQ